MAKVFLATKYKKHPKEVQMDADGKWQSEFYEVNNGPKKVDPAFVPLKEQVRQQLAAGQFMHKFKLAQFHAMNPDEIPEGYYDPLTIPHYDPADADYDLRRTAAKMVQARRLKEAEDRKKEAESDQSGTGSQSEGDNPPDGSTDPGSSENQPTVQ